METRSLLQPIRDLNTDRIASHDLDRRGREHPVDREDVLEDSIRSQRSAPYLELVLVVSGQAVRVRGGREKEAAWAMEQAPREGRQSGAGGARAGEERREEGEPDDEGEGAVLASRRAGFHRGHLVLVSRVVDVV